jgi:hypothetical protein
MYTLLTYILHVYELPQLDRYEAHVRYCRHCQKALKNANIAQTISPYLAAITAVVLPNTPSKVVGIVLSFAMGFIAKTTKGAILGYEKDEKSSAAQFAPKDKEPKTKK